MEIIVGKKYRIKKYNQRPFGWSSCGHMDSWMGVVVTVNNTDGELVEVDENDFVWNANDFVGVNDDPICMPHDLKMYRELDVSKLVCYGCAHSAVYEEYPGSPSGERPCVFCIRNPLRKEPPETTMWYDGTPAVNVPMDCYHSIDMLNQFAKKEESTRRNCNGKKGYKKSKKVKRQTKKKEQAG